MVGTLDIYSAMRMKYESYPIIRYEIAIPEELMLSQNVPMLNMTMQEIKNICDEADSISNIEDEETKKKEEIFYLFLQIMIRSMGGGENMTVEEYLNMMLKEEGIQQECSTLQEYFEILKSYEIEGNPLKDFTYDEFLNYSINNFGLDKMKEFLHVVYESFSTEIEISFIYTIKTPTGKEIRNTIKGHYPAFAIETNPDEYGEYEMTITSSDEEYEGTESIEYKYSKYLVTTGASIYLFDIELGDTVEIDELYMYKDGNKSNITDRIQWSKQVNPYSFEESTPYELEFVKNGESAKIPVLVVENPN